VRHAAFLYMGVCCIIYEITTFSAYLGVLVMKVLIAGTMQHIFCINTSELLTKVSCIPALKSAVTLTKAAHIYSGHVGFSETCT
jgi:hypothetical protein